MTKPKKTATATKKRAAPSKAAAEQLTPAQRVAEAMKTGNAALVAQVRAEVGR